MRVIKFRGWVPIYDQMINVDVLAISAVGWNSDGTGVSLAYQPHIKVMQYTGLNDINGREIYEGDIVERIETTGYKFVGKVVYEEFGFGIKPYGFFMPLSTKGKYEDGKSSFDYSVGYEVIGNIYENSELLEGGD